TGTFSDRSGQVDTDDVPGVTDKYLRRRFIVVDCQDGRRIEGTNVSTCGILQVEINRLVSFPFVVIDDRELEGRRRFIRIKENFTAPSRAAVFPNSLVIDSVYRGAADCP